MVVDGLLKKKKSYDRPFFRRFMSLRNIKLFMGNGLVSCLTLTGTILDRFYKNTLL